ncbi:MAG: prepilin-type N-terminal cleavage/methylation domain-containing protein [Verrucomicrobia bacterium]|nr:MAG: prepilin-type N-terminal cleavage/methylation domain-containing protein [Verrucomicrobiota bacterium]
MPFLPTTKNGVTGGTGDLPRGYAPAQKGCYAFTLVELLAAMAVLAVLLLICSNVFSGSIRAWNLGATYVEQNVAVRTVLRTVATDFSMATVSTSMMFRTEKGTMSLYGRPNSETYDVHFIAMEGVKIRFQSPDEVTPVHYFVRSNPDDPTRYQLCYAVADWSGDYLRRVYQKPAQVSRRWITMLDNFTWMGAQSSSNCTLLDNISAFKVLVNGQDATWWSDLDAMPLHTLPLFVDIYLGLLSDENARKAALLSGSAQAGFVTQNEKRFVQRVYFMNRDAIAAPTVP